MIRKRVSPAGAMVEILESRRLLSAAPIALASASVHTHPTAPNIVGTFDGTYATTNGQTGEIIIAITSEGKTGKVAGTLTVVGLGSLGVSGTVSVKGKFALHGAVRHFTLTSSGSVSSDGKSLAGKFATTAKHGNSHGTLNASMVA